MTPEVGFVKKLGVFHVKCTFYKRFYDYHERGKDKTFQEHYSNNNKYSNFYFEKKGAYFGLTLYVKLIIKFPDSGIAFLAF